MSLPFLADCQSYERDRDRGINGYVLPKGGDTLRGNITCDGFNILFRTSKYEAAEKYSLKEVDAYRIGDNIYVHQCVDVVRPYVVEKTCAFIQVILTGPVELYVYQAQDLYSDEEHANYYVRRKGTELFFPVSKNATHFKKEMAGFFRDNEEVSQKIQSKEMNYEQIIAIVSMYNDAKQP